MAGKWERKHSEGWVLKEGVWIWLPHVLFFLPLQMRSERSVRKVKNKSPIPQPSTYSSWSFFLLFALLVTSNAFLQSLLATFCWMLYFSANACILYPVLFCLSSPLDYVCACAGGCGVLCSLPFCAHVCFRLRWRSFRVRGKGRRIWNRTWWGESKCWSMLSNKRGKTNAWKVPLCVPVSLCLLFFQIIQAVCILQAEWLLVARDLFL